MAILPLVLTLPTRLQKALPVETLLSYEFPVPTDLISFAVVRRNNITVPAVHFQVALATLILHALPLVPIPLGQMGTIPKHELSTHAQNVVATTRTVRVPISAFGNTGTSPVGKRACMVGGFEVVTLGAGLKREVEFVSRSIEALVELVAVGSAVLVAWFACGALTVGIPGLEAVARVEDVLVLAREDSWSGAWK